MLVYNTINLQALCVQSKSISARIVLFLIYYKRGPQRLTLNVFLIKLLCTFMLIECEAYIFEEENTYIYCQFSKPSNMSVGDISHSCKIPFCKCIFNCVLGPKLFRGVFCTFSTDLNSLSNFAYYDTHKEFLKTYFFCLYQHCLLTLKPKSDETSHKKNEILIL